MCRGASGPSGVLLHASPLVSELSADLLRCFARFATRESTSLHPGEPLRSPPHQNHSLDWGAEGGLDSLRESLQWAWSVGSIRCANHCSGRRSRLDSRCESLRWVLDSSGCANHRGVPPQDRIDVAWCAPPGGGGASRHIARKRVDSRVANRAKQPEQLSG